MNIEAIYKGAIFVIALLLLSACSEGFSSSPLELPTAVALNQLYTPPADSTLTPTPFQPLPLTPTPIPTLPPTHSPTPIIPTSIPLATSTPISNTWVGYPGPIVYPPIAIPPPLGVLKQPKNQINILLLGSDQRQGDSGFRTDVIILVTINSTKNTVSLTSFPRDLYVYIPGWTMERINTAMRFGGFESLALTFEYNFGVRPDHWAMINFKGFESLIDALGGLDVKVAQSITDHKDNKGQFTVPAGTIHMDGDTALWYVRSRNSSSDFDRTRRQQEVVAALFERLLSINAVTRAREVYDNFDELIQTDMTFEEILGLAPLALKIGEAEDIHHYAVGPQQVYAWVNPYNGAQVLLPDQYLVREVMEYALNMK